MKNSETTPLTASFKPGYTAAEHGKNAIRLDHWKKGEAEALAQSFSPYIEAAAQFYTGQTAQKAQNYDDFLGVGYLALMTALSRYEEGYAQELQSFVKTEIRQAFETRLEAFHAEEKERRVRATDSIEAMTPELFALRIARTQLVDAALDELTPRQSMVLRLRFWENATLEDAGAVFGLNKESARQIESKGLQRLRHPCRSGALESLLPIEP